MLTLLFHYRIPSGGLSSASFMTSVHGKRAGVDRGSKVNMLISIPPGFLFCMTLPSLRHPDLVAFPMGLTAAKVVDDSMKPPQSLA
jgi:hypothetical protein